MSQVCSTQRLAYTAEELAALLGISRKALYNRVASRQIPHLKIGRRLIFPAQQVNEWLARHTTPAREGDPE